MLAAYKFPGPAAATPSSVVDVTPENIDAVLLSEDRVFVEAFAPWCPYCKAMAPLLEALPSRLADAGSSTLVARVDVDAYAALGERFRVTAFPTMLLFQDGKLVGRHVGVATEDALLRYASTVVPVGAAAPVRSTCLSDTAAQQVGDELRALRAELQARGGGAAGAVEKIDRVMALLRAGEAVPLLT